VKTAALFLLINELVLWIGCGIPVGGAM